MNLNINRTGVDPMTAASRASTASAVPQAEVRNSWPVNNLNVTSVNGESVEIDVPEEALRRDDALGKLFDQVFTLPAPVMPNFGE